MISKKTYINIGDRHVIIARSRKNLMSLYENNSQTGLGLRVENNPDSFKRKLIL
ncbi:MAG: hypothetical protein ACFB2X_12640 [Rivularia sp. (in: cyanobacteria)]